MKFTEMLSERWQNAGSMLCVGLDPNPTRFPHELAGRSTALYDFCCGIIDATADLVCAFKPQIAYFASCGAEAELKAVIDYIHANHPKVPVILDAKRGDIGSTAEHYAREAFERYEADCVTLSPFMGFDTIKPYLAYENKGAFILCRTSNPGGDDIQMLEVNGEKTTNALRALPPPSGTSTANSASSSAPPIPPNSPTCAASRRTFPCSCRGSALRAATSAPALRPARPPKAPAW